MLQLRPSGWLILPPTLYFIVLFVVPLVNLLINSFHEPVVGQVGGGEWSLTNYQQILEISYFHQVLWTTLRIAMWVTALSLVIGYPLAYFLARTRSRFKGLLLAVAMAPIYVSVVVRAYGLLVLLVKKGLVNQALIALHLTKDPLPLIFNETGVVIATVNVTVSFMVLAILSSLQGLDPRLEDAAASLGARPWQVFRDIVWPQSVPGVAAGTLIVFVLSVGALVTPLLVGGGTVVTIPVLAYQQFTATFNWQFGDALAFLLLLSTATLVVTYDRAVRSRIRRVSGLA